MPTSDTTSEARPSCLAPAGFAGLVDVATTAHTHRQLYTTHVLMLHYTDRVSDCEEGNAIGSVRLSVHLLPLILQNLLTANLDFWLACFMTTTCLGLKVKFISQG